MSLLGLAPLSSGPLSSNETGDLVASASGTATNDLTTLEIKYLVSTWAENGDGTTSEKYPDGDKP